MDEIEWITSEAPVGYPEAVAKMEAHVAAMADGSAAPRIWFLEHPALYTAGTTARAEDLLSPDRFPVHATRRGGEYTYHGPGQRIVYVLLPLDSYGHDVRGFVRRLEAWVIAALDRFGVKAERRDGRVGIWVQRPDKPRGSDGQPAEDKIAAIGLRVRRWISFHGLAINVEPDLDHYTGIVPCGISQHGVTSLVDLGHPVTMADLDVALRQTFEVAFDRDTQV